MEPPTILQLLAVILQATPSQYNRIPAMNAACEEYHGHPLGLPVILGAFGLLELDPLTRLTLARNPEREAKLVDFLFNITPVRIAWAEAVKGTQWTDTDWNADAAHLFITAESSGIAGTVSFAVIAAAMTLHAFQVPQDLNKVLYGAKATVRKHVLDDVAAERRREAELKAGPQQ